MSSGLSPKQKALLKTHTPDPGSVQWKGGWIQDQLPTEPDTTKEQPKNN